MIAIWGIKPPINKKELQIPINITISSHISVCEIHIRDGRISHFEISRLDLKIYDFTWLRSSPNGMIPFELISASAWNQKDKKAISPTKPRDRPNSQLLILNVSFKKLEPKKNLPNTPATFLL